MSFPAPLDERLFRAFKVFYADASQILVAASKDPFGRFLLQKAVVTGPGRVQVETRQVPAWGRIFFDNERAVHTLASYKHLLELIQSDERALNCASTLLVRSDGKPLADENLRWFFDAQVITRLVLNYLEGQCDARFDEARFLRIYRSEEEWLLTDTQTIRSVAMLSSFSGPDLPIVLDDQITIRRAADSDLSEIMNKCDLKQNEIGDRRWLLEIESKVPKKLGSHSPALGNQVDTVLTALRLTKKGGAHCSYVVCGRKDDTSGFSVSQLPPAYTGYATDLTSDSEITEFRNMFRALSDRELGAPVDFVIRRFNYAYERPRIEDRFVDLMIALESILVGEGNAGEISYKFRMRAATFLAESTTLAERFEIRDIAKTAYEMRSAIVHGSARKQADLARKLNKHGIGDICGLTERIEDYLRRSIILLLSDPSKASPERLDDRLLAGS